MKIRRVILFFLLLIIGISLSYASETPEYDFEVISYSFTSFGSIINTTIPLEDNTQIITGSMFQYNFTLRTNNENITSPQPFLIQVFSPSGEIIDTKEYEVNISSINFSITSQNTPESWRLIYVGTSGVYKIQLSSLNKKMLYEYKTVGMKPYYRHDTFFPYFFEAISPEEIRLNNLTLEINEANKNLSETNIKLSEEMKDIANKSLTASNLMAIVAIVTYLFMLVEYIFKYLIVTEEKNKTEIDLKKEEKIKGYLYTLKVIIFILLCLFAIIILIWYYSLNH
jgi:hypothetical protein